MIVYRLENDRGYGVWTAGSGDILEHHQGLYKRGRSVGSPFFDGDYRYACDSLESLMLYFGTGFGELLTRGFHVVKYKVRKNYTKSSAIELIFNFDKAKCLGRIIPKSEVEELYGWDKGRIDQIRGRKTKDMIWSEYTTFVDPVPEFCIKTEIA